MFHYHPWFPALSHAYTDLLAFFLKLVAVWCADQNSIFASPGSALTSALLCLDPGLWVAVELQSWG